MGEAAIDVYVDALRRRCVSAAGPGDTLIDDPGLVGFRRASDGRLTLLVTDDRALKRLEHLLREKPHGVINVLPSAARSESLIGAERRWVAKRLSAMICRDLSMVPTLPIPEGLVVRGVSLNADTASGCVGLSAATRLAVIADRAVAGQSPEQMAAYLRAMQPAPRLYAAVDNSDAVRATSGFRMSGEDASVFFVNTEESWRRQGIGRAMTATALHAARQAGAVRACLDASEVGASIYRSLGFETASATAQFFAPPLPKP